MPNVPTSVIAAMAAEPLPTAPSDTCCAASHQKAMPSTVVTPVVAISELTVPIRDRCAPDAGVAVVAVMSSPGGPSAP